MTLAELRALTKTLAKWLAATTSLVFAFSRFLPQYKSSDRISS